MTFGCVSEVPGKTIFKKMAKPFGGAWQVPGKTSKRREKLYKRWESHASGGTSQALGKASTRRESCISGLYL